MNSDLKKNLVHAFEFEPTSQQAELFDLLASFLEKNSVSDAFVLKGYAGTGKTTTVSAVIKALKKANCHVVMLAPTGRAAKVMASYSGQPAFTIHKHIYSLIDSNSLNPEFELKANEDSDTVYIVDESSMISDENEKEGTNLLGDLISFVFDEDTRNNKLLLVGDNAQLPPVFAKESPALNAAFIEEHYELTCQEFVLTEVKRQALDSGILNNASRCRNQLTEKQPGFVVQDRGFKDVYRVPSQKLVDGIKYAYDKFGKEQAVLLCRSNKEAVRLNRMIRHQVLKLEGSIAEGDRLMVVKNNYNSLPKDFLTEFIANGDFVEVVQVVEVFEKYGLRFANLELRLSDFDTNKTFFSYVFLDTLESEEASLDVESRKKLFAEVMQEISEGVKKGKGDKQLQLKTNPYLNALDIKYAYALTTHKSQGGQWDAVFISWPRVDDLPMLRWAYTAITRAQKELFVF